MLASTRTEIRILHKVLVVEEEIRGGGHQQEGFGRGQGRREPKLEGWIPPAPPGGKWWGWISPWETGKSRKNKVGAGRARGRAATWTCSQDGFLLGIPEGGK